MAQTLTTRIQGTAISKRHEASACRATGETNVLWHVGGPMCTLLIRVVCSPLILVRAWNAGVVMRQRPERKTIWEALPAARL